MKSSEIFFAICTLILAQKGQLDRRSFNREVHEWNVKHGLTRPSEVTKVHHMRPRRENEGKRVPTSYNLSWNYNKVPIHNQRILHHDKIKIPTVEVKMPYYVPQEHEIIQEDLPKPLPLAMKPSYYPQGVHHAHHRPMVHKNSMAVRHIYKTHVNSAPITAWRPVRHPPHKQVFYKHPEENFYNYYYPAGPHFKKKPNHVLPEKYIELSHHNNNSNIQNLTHQELDNVHTKPDITNNSSGNGQQYEKLPSPQSYTSVKQYSYDDSNNANQPHVISTKEEEKLIVPVRDISSYSYLPGQSRPEHFNKGDHRESNKQTAQQYEHLPMPQSLVSENILTHQHSNTEEKKDHPSIIPSSEHFYNRESVPKVETLPLAHSYAEVKFPKQDIKNVSLQFHNNSQQTHPQQELQEVQKQSEYQNPHHLSPHELPYANVQNHHSQEEVFEHPNSEYYPYQHELYSYQPPPHPEYATQQITGNQARARGYPYYYQPMRYTTPVEGYHARYAHHPPTYPHIPQNNIKHQVPSKHVAKDINVQSKNIEHPKQLNLYNQYSHHSPTYPHIPQADIKYQILPNHDARDIDVQSKNIGYSREINLNNQYAHKNEYENDYVDVLVPIYGDYYGHSPYYQSQEQPVVEENDTGKPQPIEYNQVESKLPQMKKTEKSHVENGAEKDFAHNKNQPEKGKVSEYEIQISHDQWKPLENPTKIQSLETSNLQTPNSTL